MVAGITKYMIDQDWHDKKFIAENVKNFDEYSKMLEKYTLDYTEGITGISKDHVKRNGSIWYMKQMVLVYFGEWV